MFINMNKKRNIGYVLLPGILALGVILGMLLGRFSIFQQSSPEEDKLRTILGLIEQQYVDEVDVDSLLEKSIPDILASLDPHSVYIPASELQATNDDLESSFGGVGVMFQLINDTVNIIEVVAGGPAEHVGLLPGDKIISANGKTLSGVKASTDDVFSTLRGKEGTKVNVKIKRSSSKKDLDYTITRGQIPSKSIDVAYMMDKEVGYVKVSKFARNTYSEFIEALLNLKLKGASQYIIDLRGNSGGFMEQAILMANEFLPQGRMIVSTKGRLPENETVAISDGNGNFQNTEITVLTNEYSASASEIFAGAIQDNDRGLVIGRRTFGKGLVQNQIALPDSSAIRLTVARYYIPSGRSIQKEYKRGKDGKYEMDIVDRYTHGEFYSLDSIHIDKSKKYSTFGGRTVYGGGGIMPDIFVPEDTTAYTGYYIEAINSGLVQKFAKEMADSYRPMMKGEKTKRAMERVLPNDNVLLSSFVNYAASNGIPARWFYINKSKDILTNQIKAAIARDLLGYEDCLMILNEIDQTIKTAFKNLKEGKSKIVIPLK